MRRRVEGSPSSTGSWPTGAGEASNLMLTMISRLSCRQTIQTLHLRYFAFLKMSFDLSFYLQHTECIWIVLAPAGERIHMDVDRLDVKSSRRSFAQLSLSLCISSLILRFSLFNQNPFARFPYFSQLLKVLSCWPWAEEWRNFAKPIDRLLLFMSI